MVVVDSGQSGVSGPVDRCCCLVWRSASAAAHAGAGVEVATWPVLLARLTCLCCTPSHIHKQQDANKEGETPLSLAGDLAAALQAARSSGKVHSNGVGAMEH